MNFNQTLSLNIKTNLPKLQQMMEEATALLQAIQDFKVEAVLEGETGEVGQPETPINYKQIAKSKTNGFEMTIVPITEQETTRVDFSDSWIKALRVDDKLICLYYDDEQYIRASVLNPAKFDIVEVPVMADTPPTGRDTPKTILRPVAVSKSGRPTRDVVQFANGECNIDFARDHDKVVQIGGELVHIHYNTNELVSLHIVTDDCDVVERVQP